MKICINCDKGILEKEKQVQVITREDNEIVDDSNYHWKCWIDYFNRCVKKKLDNAKQKAFSMVGQVAKNLKEIINRNSREIKKEVVMN